MCEIYNNYLALEAMRHNNAIYVYCMCYDVTKEVWQVSNVSCSLSLDRQKKHFWWLDTNNSTELITSLNITTEKDWKTDNLKSSSTLIEWVGTLGAVHTLFS